MTVVHNHPHPLAMQNVKPVNPQIFQKFGMVRVEDWDDRVAGLTWHERMSQGFTPDVSAYTNQVASLISNAQSDNQVVRCHSLTTGERVLLHDDWLHQPA